ncbi:MAG: nucleotidyltransferase domain-containing protein [Candidatus Hodarchaeaceae archaeon]|nr:nucleotidyltransferase domain-containing protein [Candidatus Hodarchaeaceae archaeon]
MIDRYASVLLLELEHKGAARFGELMESLKNPRTLSKKLRELSSLGMVESRDKIYSLSEKGRRAAGLAKSWFELIEVPGAEITNVDRIPHRAFADVLERYCKILLGHFKDGLLGVLVFGSVARGDWTPDSDIDLLIVVEGWKKPTWERSEELLKLRDELRNTGEFSRAVRAGFVPIIQHYPLDKDEALRFHRMYLDACLDGIILFERDGFLTGVLEGVRKKLIEEGTRRVTTPSGEFYWVRVPSVAGEVLK